MNRSRGGLAAVAAIVALGTGCDAGTADPSGAPASSSPSTVSGADPLVMRIGTDDSPDAPVGEVIARFAREVASTSQGDIVIEPTFHAAGDNVDDWDQAVARMVVSGEIEMAVIPARAWDTETVTSLRALQAPFLVTTDEHVQAIVTSDVTDELLAGLGAVGVTGLALLPESMRHVFAWGPPLVTPADFAGTTIRSARSDTTYAVFAALGATATDLEGGPVGDALTAGALDAAESGFAYAVDLPGSTTTAGNVTPFPKVNTLVINTDALDRLDERQRAALREAADRTVEWAVSNTISDAEAAKAFCDAGGTVVTAGDADLAALVQETDDVYVDLEQDDATKSLIEQVRRLRPDEPSSSAAGSCRPATPPPGSDAPTTIVHGTWAIDCALVDGNDECIRDTFSDSVGS